MADAEKQDLRAPKTILVVEDDQVLSEMLSRKIDEMGLYDVVTASCVNDAEELFDPGKYLMVLIDLHLGKSIDEGIFLAERMRNLDPFVILVAVTGFYPVFDARLVESIDDLIRKPFDFDMLQYTIMMRAIQYRRRMDLIDQISICIQSRLGYYRQEIEEIRAKQLRISEMIENLTSPSPVEIDAAAI